MVRPHKITVQNPDQIICEIQLNLFAHLFDFFTLWYK